ncbi:TOMM precursor leader peptide-binding protein [Halorubrum sp. CBA1229]|uniref:TOMM precursor leader peptide-binding protein n=1 Tax=Halorubrum sp. CBA1229 TaxID=1853699 RepID=UPI0011CDF317|nr:TOMM precursor leader peptide-binding protein [Halorubrum sp. CBA1229]QKY18623.1 TOMM precursor leader peptide-binding protein [Halorubrum sp. CBA1229]
MSNITPETEFYVPEYVEFVRIDESKAIISMPLSKKEMRGASVDLVEHVIALGRDGSTVSEVNQETDVSTETISALLSQLETADIIHKTHPEYDFWDWLVDSPPKARRSVQEATIGLLESDCSSTFHNFHVESTTFCLSSISDITEKTDDLDILVTGSIGAYPEFHQAVAEEVQEMTLPWLPVRLVGTEVRLGPLSGVGKPCYNCYRKRLLASASNPEVHSRKMVSREEHSNQPPYPEAAHQLLTSQARLEIHSVLTDELRPTTDGSVLFTEIQTLESNIEDVLKLPGCEICGTN